MFEKQTDSRTRKKRGEGKKWRRREGIEKDERERRYDREERMRAAEREDRDKMSLLMFKLLGGSLNQQAKKEIKVVAESENSGSQPIPLKLKLSSLSSLKK